MINSEIASQLSEKLDETKADLNFQVLHISSAIAEKVLPIVQNRLGVQENEFRTQVDSRSNGLDRNPEAEIGYNIQGNRSMTKST